MKAKVSRLAEELKQLFVWNKMQIKIRELRIADFLFFEDFFAAFDTCNNYLKRYKLF